MSDVFISYSRSDADVAHRLAEDLEKSGYSVFYDRELIPGDDFVKRLNLELKKASFVVLLLSPAYLRSQWAVRELELAAVAEAEEGPRVIPAMVHDTELPAFLRHRLYADLRSDYEEGLEQIVKALRSTKKMRLGAKAAGNQRARESALVSMVSLLTAGFATMVSLVGLKTSTSFRIAVGSAVGAALLILLIYSFRRIRKPGAVEVLASGVEQTYLEAMDQSMVNPMRSSKE